MPTTNTILTNLNLGKRFRVQSRSGKRYLFTFLARNNEVIVRLEDQRLARLDPQRISWRTFAEASDHGEPLLLPGDEILVETATKSTRGKLLESPNEDEVSLQLDGGRTLRLPTSAVNTILLLFKAQELRPDDRFIVRSRSGREYQGVVLDVGPGDKARVSLDGGAVVNLRLERVDLDTLLVPIPIPVGELFPKR